jgi:dimeric dUTPase (all-alpha-NTP-PPase superfamily)
MPDRLDEIFELQKAFNESIIKTRHLEGITPEEWIQKQTLAMLSELAELLDEVNFKWWKNKKPVNEHALKEELVDILHFFVSMCLSAGLTPEELYTIYKEKNAENFRRQQGQSEKQGYALPGGSAPGTPGKGI